MPGHQSAYRAHVTTRISQRGQTTLLAHTTPRSPQSIERVHDQRDQRDQRLTLEQRRVCAARPITRCSDRGSSMRSTLTRTTSAIPKLRSTRARSAASRPSACTSALVGGTYPSPCKVDDPAVWFLLDNGGNCIDKHISTWIRGVAQDRALAATGRGAALCSPPCMGRSAQDGWRRQVLCRAGCLRPPRLAASPAASRHGRHCSEPVVPVVPR